MGSIIVLITVFALLPITAIAAPKPPYVWRQLADGIDYAKYSFETGNLQKSSVHAFQIDPRKLRIDVVTSPNEREGSTAGELARQTQAMLVINGGFFTPGHKTIGLIIKDGRKLSPLHKTSWWSVFAMNSDKPFIFTAREFKDMKGVRMALQVGPRLVVGGAIPKLKEDIAVRSAVGITKDGKVVIAITEGAGITMTELARRMGGPKSDGGLECPNAMALDGGSSSQLYAKVKNFELSLSGLVRVTNGLGVFGKN